MISLSRALEAMYFTQMMMIMGSLNTNEPKFSVLKVRLIAFIKQSIRDACIPNASVQSYFRHCSIFIR